MLKNFNDLQNSNKYDEYFKFWNQNKDKFGKEINKAFTHDEDYFYLYHDDFKYVTLRSFITEQFQKLGYDVKHGDHCNEKFPRLHFYYIKFIFRKKLTFKQELFKKILT